MWLIAIIFIFFNPKEGKYIAKIHPHHIFSMIENIEFTALKYFDGFTVAGTGNRP